MLKQKMANKEWFLVISKLANLKAEGMTGLITRIVARLKLREHRGIQP